MERVGNYCRVSDDYDLDHEINLEVDKVKEQLKDVDSNTTYHQNKVKIKKAMIETILENL